MILIVVDQHDRLSADGVSCPQFSEHMLRGLRLYGNPVEGKSADFRERYPDGVDMFAKSRCLEDDGGINIDDMMLTQFLQGERKEIHAVGILPLFIIGRKMAADIA